MPLFALTAYDKPDSLQIRLDTRSAHLEHLASTPGVVRLAGPLLGEDDKPVGSLLILEAEDLAAAQAFAKKDPYVAAGLFERVEVRPWRKVICDLS